MNFLMGLLYVLTRFSLNTQKRIVRAQVLRQPFLKIFQETDLVMTPCGYEVLSGEGGGGIRGGIRSLARRFLFPARLW
jgi:hypothetical protein